jgi:hypothetical protein
MAKWIGKARAAMKRKGTEGAFTKSAHAAGESVGEHAASVLANPRASTKQKRRASFAKAMRSIARR